MRRTGPAPGQSALRGRLAGHLTVPEAGANQVKTYMLTNWKPVVHVPVTLFSQVSCPFSNCRLTTYIDIHS